MDLYVMSALGFIGLAKKGAVGAEGTDLQQKYPGLVGRVHEYLQDILVIKAGKSFMQPHFIFSQQKEIKLFSM